MPSQLFLGRADGPMLVATVAAGPAWSTPRVGRALAVGDLDHDGRLDALLVAHDTPLVYLHNRTEGGRTLTLALEGTASNRDAVATMKAGGRTWSFQRTGGGIYPSASSPRLYFGLGRVERVESVEVRWPSGRVDTFTGLATDAGCRLREGDPEPISLPRFDWAKR